MGGYDLGIHLDIQKENKKNLRLLSEISILDMFPKNMKLEWGKKCR
jgi:hypothetical protein